MSKKSYQMNTTMISAFARYLQEEEKSPATIEKYSRDVRAFYAYLPERKNVDKDVAIAYKKEIETQYKPASVNSMLASINHFFLFCGWSSCRVKTIKIQKRAFVEPETELTRTEYLRLLRAAKSKKNEQLYLVMETICATGIRVSELQFITVEAARLGRAIVNCKGKQRVVFIPRQLGKKLLKYAQGQGTKTGWIFRTPKGGPLNRTRNWAAMKSLCVQANVSPQKVFPHNLRHLFARCYYELEKDIVRLADILGHSNINTTRIYTRESGLVHERQVARLGLII